MKSPITDKEMKLKIDDTILNYRGKGYSIQYHHYFCEDSGESFTTDLLDEINIAQVHRQYQDEGII